MQHYIYPNSETPQKRVEGEREKGGKHAKTQSTIQWHVAAEIEHTS